MKKILYSLIFVFLFLPCFLHAQEEKQRIYLIGINFNSGKVSLGEISTKLGFVPGQEKEEEMSSYRYWVKIVSFTGETLEEREFSIANEISFEPPREGEVNSGPSGMLIQDQLQSMAILLYHKDGKYIELYDANKRFLEKKDIAYLSDVCGDEICQPQESYESCEKDCLANAKDGYCNETMLDIDPDCKGFILEKKDIQDNDQNETLINKSLNSNRIKYFILGGIFLLILIFTFLAYFFLVKRKRQ